MGFAKSSTHPTTAAHARIQENFITAIESTVIYSSDLPESGPISSIVCENVVTGVIDDPIDVVVTVIDDVGAVVDITVVDDVGIAVVVTVVDDVGIAVDVTVVDDVGIAVDVAVAVDVDIVVVDVVLIVLPDAASAFLLLSEASINVTTGGVTIANLPHCSRK